MDDCLHNLEKFKSLNAFVRTYDEEARQRAALLDAKPMEQRAPLHGLVVGLKDMFSYKAHPLQAASKILEGYTAKYNATAVSKLLDNGAIIVGHQNCDEFGMGSTNEHSVYGPVHNMLNPELVPGGSSGGGAVGVQTHSCHVSLGTDTGGSVRQPASFCGVVGLKPTYSRVSRYGVVAFASSLDTVSILAQTVQDCTAVLEAIAGADEFDNTVSRRPVEAYTKSMEYNAKARIAYFREAFELDNLQPEVRHNTELAMASLQDQGHVVEAIDFPLLKHSLPTYYVIACAEASSNLACYDGVRYGYRAKDCEDLQEMYIRTRSEGFGQEVKRRVILGTYVLSAGHAEEWFVKAQKVRRVICEEFDKVFGKYDFIIMPTTPTTAFPIGTTLDPMDEYLADLYTVPASLAGLPAISIPNGVDKKGLPIGLQIVANSFCEKNLLAFANSVAAASRA